MVTVELTQEEAELVRSLGFFHTVANSHGLLLVSVALKLEDQGVAVRSVQFHVNEFGNLVIDSIH